MWRHSVFRSELLVFGLCPQGIEATQRAEDDSMAACLRVDDFLDVYGLWEMQASFEFHRIDDMEVVVRLERSHIALLSDRVGIQVLALNLP